MENNITLDVNDFKLSIPSLNIVSVNQSDEEIHIRFMAKDSHVWDAYSRILALTDNRPTKTLLIKEGEIWEFWAKNIVGFSACS